MPVVLLVLLWFGVATIWVEGRWAVSILEAGAFLLTACTVFQGRWKIYPHWAVGCLAAVATWGIAQMLFGWTVSPAQTEWAVLYWMAAACFCALGTLVRNREYFRNGLLWFGVAATVLTLAQLYTSNGRILWLIPTHEAEQIFGTFPNRNHYAAFIELLFPMALWRAFEDRGAGWLYAGAASLMYGSVIASASRAGVILVTLELAAVLVLVKLRGVAKAHFRARLILVLAVVIGFAAVAGPETVWRRLLAPNPYAVRREYLESALAMVSARPVRGFGLGTWASAYPAYAVADFGVTANHAHSEWGQWGAEGGVGLVAIMAGLFVLAFRRGFRSVWALGLVAVMLHALVDYPLVRLGLGSWWFVILGVAIGENRPNGEPATEARTHTHTKRASINSQIA
jgi:O-antigen ligase